MDYYMYRRGLGGGVRRTRGVSIELSTHTLVGWEQRGGTG